MVAGTQSCGSQCYDFLLEPFHQGFLNISDAIEGTKTQTVAQNALAQAAPGAPSSLSLGERISKVAIGLLLFIPIINSIAMTILKSIDSEFFYKTGSVAATPPAAAAPPAGGGLPLPVGDVPPPAPIPDLPVVEIPDEPAPAVLTEEEMIARKIASLTRLDQIEQMLPANAGLDEDAANNQAIGALSGSFECNPNILEFNLNAILDRFPTNQAPSRLLDYMDWAGVSRAYVDADGVQRNNQQAFRTVIQRYGTPNPFNGERGELIEGYLKNLVAYFNHYSARAEGDAATRLKEQFNEVCDSLIDANNNCIDQVLSQMQTLTLNILAEGASSQGSTSPRKLIAQAGLALCKYRTDLLKEILLRQNPDEHHMADLERMATQRVAAALGMGGGIFGAGAQYNVVNDIDAKVGRAVNTFLDGDAQTEKYNPEKYLLRELQTSIGTGNLRTLRGELMIWAGEHYNWEEEDADAPQPHLMDRRISKDFDTLSVTMGGDLTPAATILLMEKLGLVTQLPPAV